MGAMGLFYSIRGFAASTAGEGLEARQGQSKQPLGCHGYSMETRARFGQQFSRPRSLGVPAVRCRVGAFHKKTVGVHKDQLP